MALLRGSRENSLACSSSRPISCLRLARGSSVMAPLWACLLLASEAIAASTHGPAIAMGDGSDDDILSLLQAAKALTISPTVAQRVSKKLDPTAWETLRQEHARQKRRRTRRHGQRRGAGRATGVPLPASVTSALQSMAAAPNNATVQVEGCKALQAVDASDVNAQNAAAAAGVIEAAIGAQKAFPENMDVQVACTLGVSTTLLFNRDNGLKAGKLGGLNYTFAAAAAGVIE